eukprot:m.26749 g.26749  ORF g.26749 m.26749 type:complete len:257 (-) comp11836_c0_seq1:1671-2441(-)
MMDAFAVSEAAAAAAAASGGKGKAAATQPGKSGKQTARQAKPRRQATEKDKGKEPDDLPRCAREVLTILKAMGVTDHDPRVVPQLLEFSFRYIGDVLDEAKRYAEHRTNEGDDVKMNKDDVRLAVQAKLEMSCSGPPPRELLLDIARKKNATPLPLVADDKYGVRLPPDRYCLTSRNYVVLPQKRKAGSVHGPWAMPHTQTAIEAAKRAKTARTQRKLGAEAKDAMLTDSAAPTELGAQVDSTAQKTGSDDEDYDA